MSSVGPNLGLGLVLEPEPVICSPVCLRSAEGPSETMGHRVPVTDQMWACRSHGPHRTRMNCWQYCTHRDNSFHESRSGKAWCDSTAAEKVGLPGDPEVNTGHCHWCNPSQRHLQLVPKTCDCTPCSVRLPKERFEHSCKSFCCYTERQTQQRDNKQQNQRKWKCSQCSNHKSHFSCREPTMTACSTSRWSSVRLSVCPSVRPSVPPSRRRRWLLWHRHLEGTIVILLHPLCATHTCTDLWLDSEGEKDSQGQEVEPFVWFHFYIFCRWQTVSKSSRNKTDIISRISKMF